jgi:hypothetical protein
MNARSLLPLLGLCGLALLASAGAGCAGDDASEASSPATASGTESGDKSSGGESFGTPGRSSGPGSGSGTSDEGGLASGSGSAGGSAAEPSTPADPTSPPVVTPPTQSGLTAGDWDDNANFGWFEQYQTNLGGQDPAFDCRDRVLVRVSSPTGRPVGGVSIDVVDSGATVTTIQAGTDGRAIVCPTRDGVKGTLSLVAHAGAIAGTATAATDPATNTWEIALAADTAQTTALDLAFVIDTTGSMGDELAYLNKEIAGIAADVTSRFPNVDTRYSLVVYKDQGDAYVTRSFGFADLGSFSAALAEQTPGGGGDTPEAMDAALAEMGKLAWRPGHVARLSFLVADAPPHATDEAKTVTLAHEARRNGIRIYPIAASGVDDNAEKIMRVSGQLTLGRYIFLTDDSGIGNSHAEPHIPCYEVSTLAKVVRRAVASEILGTRALPEPGEIIRSVGEPVDGICTLASGQKAVL